jgi:DNA-binding transcriptional regulator LsrR (DeoR family)
VDVAFVGIGAPSPDSVVMRDGSILHQSEIDKLQKQGAVGDIALRFFDTYGQPIASELDLRIIGMELDEFSNLGRVVGVTGGPQKSSAILGALRGQYIDVLITDHATAKCLLETDIKNRIR